MRPPARAPVALLLALTTSLAAPGCSLVVAGTATAPSSVRASAAPTGPVTPTPTTDADGWEVVGTSVQGRRIRARTLGHGPRKVLFVGGIHGDETEGAYTTTQLPAAFTDAGLADAVTLTILEDANPDGRAAGIRDNANGVDINRTFPAKNFDTSNGGTR